MNCPGVHPPAYKELTVTSFLPGNLVDSELHASAISEHVLNVAQRLTDELGEEQ